MKPILFSADMREAARLERKTQTRRPVTPPPDGGMYRMPDGSCWPGFWGCTDSGRVIKPQYSAGDVLYLAEPWKYIEAAGDMCAVVEFPGEETVLFEFESKERAAAWRKYEQKPREHWQSPYFMPREAARVFFLVGTVDAAPVRDITAKQVRAEGCRDVGDFWRVWDDCYAAPRPVRSGGKITGYVSYPSVPGTRKDQYKGLPWTINGNPWAWAYYFEKISREEARKLA